MFTTHSISADAFLRDLKPFFQMISSLSRSFDFTRPPEQEKIRIAILDSGMDETDPKIRPAIKFGRINALKNKNFVGKPEDLQDTHGHGTHVTRLLLEVAPAAEIYMGKICTGKMINDEFMPKIAEVSLVILCDPQTPIKHINANH